MRNRNWLLAKSLSAFVLMMCPLVAAEPTDGRADYLRDIKPILKARCFACHGSLKQEAGLRLDAGELIRKGSDNGTVLTPGQPGGKLLERIASEDPSHRMPPEGKPLEPDQIRQITTWIEQGATSPNTEQPEADPRRHWSFQRPVRTAVPADATTSLASNPIDVFIAQERTRTGLASLASAPKPTLLRRVSLDLIGLPPTRSDLHEFLDDESPDALEKVVDRLLASPQYGERWGRHWMDIWRYSDWYGRRQVPDVWNSAPQIWRWRDWIVNSLNRDKGYDRMVAEMLAADEIDPENDEAGYATGYLIRNWYALNPNDWMRSNVEHTGKAFLGLTFNCAHCHDHKYDPILQDDYFRLRAFFEPISIRQDRVAGEADPGPFQEYNYSTLRKIVRLGGVRIFDKTPDAPTWFYTGGDERNRVSSRGSIPPGVPAFLSMSTVQPQQVSLPTSAWYPGLRPSIQQTILAEKRAALQKAEAELPAARTAAETALPPLKQKLDLVEAEFAQARIVSEQAGQATAIAGKQSLLLNATNGRRVVQHGLKSIKALGDGSSIQFQIQILKDAHVNFQLANDLTKGLTATCVIFEKGQIRAYRAGSFEEFEVGKYDFAAGQNRFEVTLVLRDQENNCQLTIRSIPDNKILTDRAAIARNGWNPVGQFNKGILFDVRTGCVAAFDELSVTAPSSGDATAAGSPSTPLARYDFEAPVYEAGKDVIGIEGWGYSGFSQAPATSVISATLGNDSLEQVAQRLQAARRAVAVHTLAVESLECRRAAAAADLTAIEARIAADQARYQTPPSADTQRLIQSASTLSRAAQIIVAQADLLTKDQALASCESKSADDPKRAAEIDAATKQLAVAQEELQKVRVAADDPAHADDYPALGPAYPQTSTGRRKALAEWITSSDNPLTARVAVNHIWLRHFHSPLVSTVYDFGRNGSPPTHPALLDWLSVEFMSSGWSMKHLHRRIVTSEIFQIASASRLGEHPSHAIDPENRLHWRRNTGRMEAEVVRDSLLSVAGQLDPQIGGQEFENAQALTTFRRSLYYSCHPELDGKSAFGALFDAPEPGDCYRRTNSIIPQQALALTNSDLIHQSSGRVSVSLWNSLPADRHVASDFIVAAYEQLLTRRPTQAELDLCERFLISFRQDEANQNKGRESLVRAILNHNDFIAIR